MVKKSFLISLISLSLLLAGCTYSIAMVHTEGTASDVIDETQSTSAKIDPTLSIPASLIP